MKIETNGSATDLWSIVHFVVPFTLGYCLGMAVRTNPKLRRRMVIGWFTLQVALFIGGLLIIAWEIGEQHNLFEWIGCVEESGVNYVTDVLIGSIGLFLGFLIGLKGK